MANGQPAYALKLADVLQSVGVCSFACSQAVDTPTPLIEVDGLDEPLTLPLTPAAAQSLKALCTQAPFGRGASTVFDTRVRHTWQLDADKFHVVLTPSWLKALNSIVEGVCTGLGLADNRVRVEAQPYKLLLYEQGSFFAPHKDTEKVAGMFGTLVVQLPSTFRGGELVVRHNGQQQVFGAQARGVGDASLSYVAFYADCEHEVKPVTQGHRLCLTYNLRLAGSPAPATSPTSQPALLAHLARLCGQWEADPQGPAFLVYMLEHRYTQEGRRGLASLKGNDVARAQLLEQLSRQNGLGLALVRARCHESGDGGDDEYEWDSDAFEMCDVTYSVDHWAMLAGQPLASMGRITITEQEMLPKDVFEKLTFDRQERTGPTGNEGAPVDRWYHHAALVLWPASQRARVIARSRGAPIILLQELLSRVRDHQQQQQQQQQQHGAAAAPSGPQPQTGGGATLPSGAAAELTALCKGIAAAVELGHSWRADPYEWHSSSSSSGEGLVARGKKGPSVDLQRLLPALQGLVQLGLQEAAAELLVTAAKGRKEPDDLLLLLPFLQQHFIPTFGWPAVRPVLEQLVQQELRWPPRAAGGMGSYEVRSYGDSDDSEEEDEALEYCPWLQAWERSRVWSSPVARLLLALLGLQPLHMDPTIGGPAVAAAANKMAVAWAARWGAALAPGWGQAARQPGRRRASAAAAAAPVTAPCVEQVQQVAACPAAADAVRAAVRHMAAERVAKARQGQVMLAHEAEMLGAFQLLTVLGMSQELQQLLQAMQVSDTAPGPAAAAGRRSSSSARQAQGPSGAGRQVLSADAKCLAAGALTLVALGIGAWLGADPGRTPRQSQAAAAAGAGSPAAAAGSSPDDGAAAAAAAAQEVCRAAAGCYRDLAGFCCSGLQPQVASGPPKAGAKHVLPADALQCCIGPAGGPCQHCSAAQEFLSDAGRTRWEVSVARRHVEQQLQRVPGLQLSTDSSRRPIRLVVQKTDAHYRQQLESYQAARTLVNALTAQLAAQAQAQGHTTAAAAAAAAAGVPGSAATGRRQSLRSAAAAGGGGGRGRGRGRGRGKKQQPPGRAAAAAAAAAASAEEDLTPGTGAAAGVAVQGSGQKRPAPSSPGAGAKKQRPPTRAAAAAAAAPDEEGEEAAAAAAGSSGGLTGRKRRPEPSSAAAGTKMQHPPRGQAAAAAAAAAAAVAEEGDAGGEEGAGGAAGAAAAAPAGPVGFLYHKLLRERQPSGAPTHFIRVLGKLWGRQ